MKFLIYNLLDLIVFFSFAVSMKNKGTSNMKENIYKIGRKKRVKSSTELFKTKAKLNY